MYVPYKIPPCISLSCMHICAKNGIFTLIKSILSSFKKCVSYVNKYKKKRTLRITLKNTTAKNTTEKDLEHFALTIYMSLSLFK